MAAQTERFITQQPFGNGQIVGQCQQLRQPFLAIDSVRILFRQRRADLFGKATPRDTRPTGAGNANQAIAPGRV